MKSYAAPIAVSAVIFLTMLQPCPAPVITTLAIAGAGAAIFGGGVGVGAWAAGHGIGLEKPPVVVAPAGNEMPQRRPALPNFEQCTADGLATAQSLAFPANGSIIVADLPQSCMGWFDHYNLHPQIGELNDAHGTITVINGSAVELSDLPPYVMSFVESSLLNATQEKTVVSRVRRALVAAEGLTA